MRAPSVARLVAELHVTREQATLIRKLAHAVDNQLFKVIYSGACPKTAAYARSCYSNPFNSHMWRVTMALHAIDSILGTHGVEGLGEPPDMHSGPPYEYCNAGDSYAATLIYTRATDTLRIGAWGDIAERML